VGVASATGDAPFVTLSARKRIALLDGDATLLTAKARVDLEPSSGKVRGRRGGGAGAARRGVLVVGQLTNCCRCSFWRAGSGGGLDVVGYAVG